MDQISNNLTKLHAVLLDVLLEFPIAELTDGCLDREKWGRKVFKLYKGIKSMES
jgi:hypothetical protein